MLRDVKSFPGSCHLFVKCCSDKLIIVRTHRKFLPFLYYFLGTFFIFVLFILLIDPALKFNLFAVSIDASFFFFLLLFVTLFFLFTFIFANKRRGILSSLLICFILFIRSLGFRSGYQVGILLIIVFLVEYLLSRRPNN